MNKSKIEWTTMTYNPWVGCSKVSPGCLNCYAERMAKRLKAMGVPQYQDVVDENGWTGILRARRSCFPKLPGEAAGPKMIFVGSMTDIFHEQAPDAAIRELFFHMLASGGKNTFQILTKRIERAVEFFDQHFELGGNPKFWIGVSVCNQEEADEKIPELLKINAAVRFVSVEPMLVPVDIKPYLESVADMGVPDFPSDEDDPHAIGTVSFKPRLNWVVCGGESGPGARPMHPYWPRNLRDDCVAAGVPFFFKQWGEWGEVTSIGDDPSPMPRSAMAYMDGTVAIDWKPGLSCAGAIHLARLGRKRTGRELDGRVWDELPADLRVRDMPDA